MRTAGTNGRTGAQLLLRQRVAIQAHKIIMLVCRRSVWQAGGSPRTLRQGPSEICNFVVFHCVCPPDCLPGLRNFLVCRRRDKAIGQTSTGLRGYWWVN